MGSLAVVGPVFLEVFVPDVRHSPGEERYVARIPVALGGALNPASVAAALGMDVRLLHPAGDGLLDAAIRAAVRRLGIVSATWPSRDDPFVSLVFSDPSDRGFVSHGDMGCFGRCPPIPAADWVYVGGISEAYALAERVAGARAAGARVATTGCWSPDDLARLRFETAPRWDLLVLNRREAGIAMGDREAGIAMGDRVAGIAMGDRKAGIAMGDRVAGIAMGDREAGIAMGDRVAGIAMGDAESAPGALAGRAAWSVVVTDGGRGAFGVLLGEEVREAAEPVTVVDPTGAGDAFAAGLVVALDRGLSPREAVRLANRVAGRVVGIHGGTVRDRALLAGL